MFKTDKRKYLLNFLEKHPNLNRAEEKLISDTTKKLNNPKVSEYRALTSVTNELRKLSLNHNLSKDGRILMKKLHRNEWFCGLLCNLGLI
ncbi:hypothetical protein QMA60_08830 [Leuconostoc suionicum]|uniref:Enterocin A Immunity n=1 Tax=Leuconostoc suionicum TaxID=1511761 RepID=A0A2N9KF27_9LACO|nr:MULTISPECIES: hypothetical protein [Leuconostoc]API72981.1 hypothetical protein A6B45_10015 [Leuconostoc suionicum]MBE4726767.1 hypothetical protein [Leuconostoc suionicum]MCT4402856.1 hypothetical protein [Leuconostoc suionicum]MDI6498696.1 hypothetical protein [Leuconostoc suionicum]MDI6500753.1 hypothetical protein [Leuconostoc suionicum]